MFTDRQHALPLTARFSNTSSTSGSKQGGEALRVLKGHRPREAPMSVAPSVNTRVSPPSEPLRQPRRHMDASKEVERQDPIVDGPMNTVRGANAVATPAQAAVQPTREGPAVVHQSSLLPSQSTHRIQSVDQANSHRDPLHRADCGHETLQQRPLSQPVQPLQATSGNPNNPSTTSRIPQHICTHNVPYDVCKLRKLHLKGIAAEIEACFEQFAEADGPDLLQELQKESRRLMEIRNALIEACKRDADVGSHRISFGGDGAYNQSSQGRAQTAGQGMPASCHQPPLHLTQQLPPRPEETKQSFPAPQVQQCTRNEGCEFPLQPSFQTLPVQDGNHHQPHVQMQTSFQHPQVHHHNQQEHQYEHDYQRHYRPQDQPAFGNDVVANDLPPPELLPSTQPAEFQSNSHDRIDASSDPLWRRTDFEWSKVRWLDLLLPDMPAQTCTTCG